MQYIKEQKKIGFWRLFEMQRDKEGPYANKPLPKPVGADTKEGALVWAKKITEHSSDPKSIIYKMLDDPTHTGTILKTIMTNPVILLETGHLYDMDVLNQWFESQYTTPGRTFRCPNSNIELTDPTYIPFWAGRIFLEEQIKLIKEKEAAVGSQKSSSSSSSSLVSNKQPQHETKPK